MARARVCVLLTHTRLPATFTPRFVSTAPIMNARSTCEYFALPRVSARTNRLSMHFHSIHFSSIFQVLPVLITGLPNNAFNAIVVLRVNGVH